MPSLNSKKSSPLIKTIQNNKGSAMVMAAIFMIVAAVLVVAGAQLVKTARQQANQQAYAVAMAENAADAGLQDAIGWFKRQNIQPVAANPTCAPTPHPTPTYPVTITTNVGPLTVTYTDQAFNPVYNTTNPVSTDTIDPYAGTVTGIGLVNEFSPDGAGSVSQATTDGTQSRWERYEVRQQQPGTFMSNAVHDVTVERMSGKLPGSGFVWSLQSIGYYYKRRDFTKSASAPYYWTKDYKTPPNQLLATARMQTEIRKISTTLPWGVNAALYMYDVPLLKTGADTYITNEKQATAYSWASYASGAPATAAANEVVGAGITETALGSSSLSTNTVFGMSISQFANMDGVIKANTNTNFSSQTVIPPNSIIYYNGNLTIDPAGANSNLYYIGYNGYQSGLLVVNGNFTMNSSAATVNSFYGMVYVNGSVNLSGSTINGTLVTGPNAYGVTLTSSNGNPAGVFYNSYYIQFMQTAVAGYLEDISARKIFMAIPND